MKKEILRLQDVTYKKQNTIKHLMTGRTMMNILQKMFGTQYKKLRKKRNS